MTEEKIHEQKQQEMQEKFMEFQQLHKEMQELQGQMQKAEEQLMELEYTQQSMEEISQAKENTEILVPVANGVFAHAKLQNPGNFIVNAGAETCVGQSTHQVKELFANQAKQVVEVHEKMGARMQELMTKLKQAEESLENIMKE